jgi:hypothetical protein
MIRRLLPQWGSAPSLREPPPLPIAEHPARSPSATGSRGRSPGGALRISRERDLRLAPALLLCLLPSALLLFSCSENETPFPDKSPYQAVAPSRLPCVPNLDGKIEANELAPQIGLAAGYLVSPAGSEREVDLAGRTNPEGKLVWQLGIDFADDRVAKITASDLEGKWYAPSFKLTANAFVTPIDLGGFTEGIYTNDETGIYLHGVASREENPPEGKTLLVYSTPIALYKFPIEPGAAWATTSEVKNATLRGLPYAGRDTYEMKVDGSGELGLPDFVLTQALRVRTFVRIVPAAGQETTQRQTGFLFECLGEVARATSKLNEPNEGFTTASELRRLGLGR